MSSTKITIGRQKLNGQLNVERRTRFKNSIFFGNKQRNGLVKKLDFFFRVGPSTAIFWEVARRRRGEAAAKFVLRCK